MASEKNKKSKNTSSDTKAGLMGEKTSGKKEKDNPAKKLENLPKTSKESSERDTGKPLH